MISNSLKQASREVLEQLVEVLSQTKNLQYTESLHLLAGNSIGKHTRHIIEFFECVLQSLHTGIVAYDLRERNLQLETNITYAIHTLETLTDSITAIKSDQLISLQLSLYPEEKRIEFPSTLCRELVYTIEHAVHHMAIIRMAIQSAGWNIQLPDNFGIAHSTVQYQRHQLIGRNS